MDFLLFLPIRYGVLFCCIIVSKFVQNSSGRGKTYHAYTVLRVKWCTITNELVKRMHTHNFIGRAVLMDRSVIYSLLAANCTLITVTVWIKRNKYQWATNCKKLVEQYFCRFEKSFPRTRNGEKTTQSFGRINDSYVLSCPRRAYAIMCAGAATPCWLEEKKV